jgi:hypothetical protein
MYALDINIDNLFTFLFLNRLRVQAVNNVGPGPFSPILRITTQSLPPAPPKLECAGVGHNYLKLKWGDGKNPNFTQYTVESDNTWTKE